MTVAHIYTHIHTYMYTHAVPKCRRVFRRARTNRCVNLLTFYPHVSTLSSPFRPAPIIRTTSYYPFPVRPGHSACSIEYFLSAKSRKMTLIYFEKFFNLTPYLFSSVRPQYVIPYDNPIPKRFVFHPVCTASKSICRCYLQYLHNRVTITAIDNNM